MFIVFLFGYLSHAVSFVITLSVYTQTASLFVEDSRVGPFKNDFIHNNYSTIHNNYLERKWIRNPKNSVEMTSKVVCIRYVCYIHMSAYVCILLRMLHTTRRNDPVYVMTTVCSQLSCDKKKDKEVFGSGARLHLGCLLAVAGRVDCSRSSKASKLSTSTASKVRTARREHRNRLLDSQGLVVNLQAWAQQLI